MGVPRFFRWLSERYPLINQTITSNTLAPEFDNLYLDMNGIIHNCTHPTSGGPEPPEPLTERDMILGIFHYIDKLFQLIKPKKLFYMAIDGVAPRAKLNQQRQRRFRSAKAAREEDEKMIAKGQTPPAERFDSNCITPGTEFMDKLNGHLRYFIRKKMLEDPNWARCNVIFSGHEVPGEGEHKIMEYIRHEKAQPGWNPNTTHCLYGLDADLVMLALTTHEPHFSLLREDVLSRQSKGKKMKDTADKDFHLLHISLVREYLDMDFRNDSMPFKFNVENIIDDFIFLCFLIGNDFLPHMSTIDIADGSFNRMLDIYKTLLPSLGGYIVENSSINLQRAEKLFKLLAPYERQAYDTLAGNDLSGAFSQPSSLHASLDDDEGESQLFGPPDSLGLGDRLAQDLKSIGVEDSDFIVEEDDSWKDTYYVDKFKVPTSDKAFYEQVKKSYIEGLIWVLNYYQNGCISWGWFFPYYYGPLLSDLTDLSSLDIKFDMGEPFTPYQQLMAVLPRASANFLPIPHRRLMISPSSPISDFYPDDFATDLNGKKNDWEAIVLVPFVDQKRLVDAIQQHVNVAELTPEEVRRNGFGKSMFYEPSSMDSPPYLYPSSLPGVFHDISRCTISEAPYELPSFPGGSHNGFSLCDGVQYGISSPPGFPTLNTLPIYPQKKVVHVNIFGNNSGKESMLIHLVPPHLQIDESIIEDDQLWYKQKKLTKESHEAWGRSRSFIGKRVHVDYPYTREAYVVGASTVMGRMYENGGDNITQNPGGADGWIRDALVVHEHFYSKKAVDIGPVQVMLHVRGLTGMGENIDGSRNKMFLEHEQHVPLQLCFPNRPTTIEDARLTEKGPAAFTERFSLGQEVLFLGTQYYGSPATVESIDTRSSRLNLNIRVTPIPTWKKAVSDDKEDYQLLRYVARNMNISTRTLETMTSRAFFQPGRYNLALVLRYHKQRKQILGYSRLRQDNQWEFSQKAIRLLWEYMSRYPMIWKLVDENPNAQDFSLDRIPLPELQPGESEKKMGERIISMVRPIREWLDQQEPHHLPEVTSIGRIPADWSAVHAIQDEASNFAAQQNAQPKNKLLRGITADQVLPASKSLPSSMQEKVRYYLGNRIAIATDNVAFPFGAQGTLISKKGEYADVIMDTSYVGGTTLNGICSDMRGATLPVSCLLNLSARADVYDDPEAAAQMAQMGGNQSNGEVLFGGSATSFGGNRGGPRGGPNNGGSRGGGGPKPNSRAEKSGEPDAELIAFIEKSLKLLRESGAPQLAFPKQLNSFARRTVHQMAEKAGFTAESQGEGQERFIVVINTPQTAPLQNTTAPQNLSGSQNIPVPQNVPATQMVQQHVVVETPHTSLQMTETQIVGPPPTQIPIPLSLLGLPTTGLPTHEISNGIPAGIPTHGFSTGAPVGHTQEDSTQLPNDVIPPSFGRGRSRQQSQQNSCDGNRRGARRSGPNQGPRYQPVQQDGPQFQQNPPQDRSAQPEQASESQPMANQELNWQQQELISRNTRRNGNNRNQGNNREHNNNGGGRNEGRRARGRGGYSNSGQARERDNNSGQQYNNGQQQYSGEQQSNKNSQQTANRQAGMMDDQGEHLTWQQKEMQLEIIATNMTISGSILRKVWRISAKTMRIRYWRFSYFFVPPREYLPLSTRLSMTRLAVTLLLVQARRALTIPMYGKFCGPGGTHGLPKADGIDEVDKACWEHDICWDKFGLFDLGCDRMLVRDVLVALKDPSLSTFGWAFGNAAAAYFSITPVPYVAAIHSALKIELHHIWNVPPALDTGAMGRCSGQFTNGPCQVKFSLDSVPRWDDYPEADAVRVRLVGDLGTKTIVILLHVPEDKTWWSEPVGKKWFSHHLRYSPHNQELTITNEAGGWGGGKGRGRLDSVTIAPLIAVLAGLPLADSGTTIVSMSICEPVTLLHSTPNAMRNIMAKIGRAPPRSTHSVVFAIPTFDNAAATCDSLLRNGHRFNATVGWDPLSGLGSPQFDKLSAYLSKL
ncbi:5'-3' exoribonuclease 1 (ISS) [Planoprotostelium fungivorum]|uniref:5'-3' exoribonuclease 2 n=1 Tax=Planoprotostelium fungivorum TaxID=1890364 RepID=A0A2P6NW21_9EUKA|nr:5'-3' exoribonuclease 1 (ISS) [Planoprotostelium fungivorum]